MGNRVKKNLLRIQEDIVPCKPRIIAVTKYFGKEGIVEAYEAGLRDFGESRAIEACEKIESLTDEIKTNSTFHFIGHLQTNKVKYVVKVFDYIHSIDSLKLAQIISEQAKLLGKKQKVLLQINNACEEQKFGFDKSEIYQIFEQIQKLDGIEIVGLMNMAPIDASEDELKSLFSEIVQIRNEIQNRFNCKLKELSMGMSQDYKIAAQAGATMLRIGRKLFI